MDLVVRIGGEAGWGLASASRILAEIGRQLGYYIFESKNYSSRIKGGHNYHTLRFSDSMVRAEVEKVDVLLALDEETQRRHQAEIVLDVNKVRVREIETEMDEKNIRNGVFLGAAVKTLGVDFSLLQEIMGEFFEKKPNLLAVLLAAARKGYEQVEKVREWPVLEKKIYNYVNGNEAICQGALEAGLGFHAQYPMTPVSGILHYLMIEAAQRNDLVVVQPEDEIAAINMALGASYAGVRTMTATSGGGFCLMTEGLSLAGMAELPLVLVMGQRPGPATGIPTKQEQGDLKFVLSAGHGEFPRIVAAPGSVEECYVETKRDFYLAEKYSVPALLLIDKHLAESFQTVSLKDNLGIDFSKRFSEKKDFVTGDEHNEEDLITEDAEIRKRMMKKRMEKLELIKKELPKLDLMGPQEAKITVVSWGSNQGAILEAVEKLNKEGKRINFLCLKYLCPFQEGVKEILERAEKLVLVENNYSGQLGDLIREKTGVLLKDKILRYDGKTFTVNEIYWELLGRC